MDSVAALFKQGERKPKMKTVHRNKTQAAKTHKTTTKNTSSSKNEKQQKVDNILDKISKSGYESLSKAEKDYLFQAGKED